MDFNFSDEQSMLRDMVRGFLADNYSIDARRAAVASETGWRAQIWREFAELGLLGAPFGEELGGFGGGAVETMIVMEEFGRALVIEPYLATVVIAGGFLRHSGHPQAADWIRRIIGGEAVFAFAHAEPQGRHNLADLRTRARREGADWVLNGHKAVVTGAPWATHLIVPARTGGSQREPEGVSVFVVERGTPGITTKDYATIDGLRASEVYLEGVRVSGEALVGSEGAALPLIERVVDEALAAIGAEACGVMRRMHEDTVEYTRQRKQFGQPIADFQVVQHRMVDMFIQLEQAEAMTQMATLALGMDTAERSRAASAAKVQVGRACRFVAQNAVQLHGGIGVTDELALGQYFKRATIIESAFGSVDHHLARYERLAYDG